MKSEPITAGARIIRSVRNAQKFARGEVVDGSIVHHPDISGDTTPPSRDLEETGMQVIKQK